MQRKSKEQIRKGEKMKKVAIATFIGDTSLNYGSVLQATAMQKLVCDCGRVPVTINYVFNPSTKKHVCGMIEGIARSRRLGSSYFLHWLAFRKFIKKNLKLSTACYSEEDIIQYVKKECDTLLCGSDAIWKDCFISPLFLWDYEEIRDLPALSYAPSIQKGVVTYENMSLALEHFVGLSGREKEVGEILKQYTDKNVATVLDPTLSVEEGFWKKMVRGGRSLVKEDYILCYFLSEAEPHHLSVEKIKKKYHVDKIVYINTDLIDTDTVGRQYTDYQGNDYSGIVGPTEFLSLFRYATAVCTDSFHGMCFSIIFRKDYFVFSRELLWEIKDDYRFFDIMKRLKTGNRTVIKNKDIEKLQPIDYEKVEEALYLERQHSVDFLKDSLLKCQ